MNFTKFFSKDAKNDTKTPYVMEYKGLSDFLTRAPNDKKIEVFTEAARRANEDQKRTLEKAEFSAV